MQEIQLENGTVKPHINLRQFDVFHEPKHPLPSGATAHKYGLTKQDRFRVADWNQRVESH